MKHIILTIITIICLSFVCSCNYSQEDIDRLNATADSLNLVIKEYNNKISYKQCVVTRLNNQERELKALVTIRSAGKTPHYWIKIRSNTYKYTKAIVWIEVTEDFYNKHELNSDIKSNDGCTVTVINKEIR